MVIKPGKDETSSTTKNGGRAVISVLPTFSMALHPDVNFTL